MSESADQQLVYDLMRKRLMELFGPGGSFRVTLGRATADEGFFAATVADTVAWEVAAAVEAQVDGTVAEAPRHEVAADPQAEYEALWAHVEAELLIRRTGPDAFLDDVDIVATPEHLAEPEHAGVRAA
ncbi:hypothetical protein BH11ACT4_BH11ACT4_02950 [soil metagenome]